jgi:hypothetical protein
LVDERLPPSAPLACRQGPQHRPARAAGQGLRDAAAGEIACGPGQQELAAGSVPVGGLLDREQEVLSGPLELVDRRRSGDPLQEADRIVRRLPSHGGIIEGEPR